jgi:hypothetical protein
MKKVLAITFGFLVIASTLALAQRMASPPLPNPYSTYPDGTNIWGMQYKYGRVMAVYYLTLTKIQITGPYNVKVDTEEHKNALVQKIDTTIDMIKKGQYTSASNKIKNDIIKHGEQWILTTNYLDGTRYADHSFSFKSPLYSAAMAIKPEYVNTVILDVQGHGTIFVMECANCVSAGPFCKFYNM